MRYLERDQLLSLIELICKVQEIYYHDWEIKEGESWLNRKDV